MHAKEAVILGLEGAEIEDSVREDAGERAQNWAQSLIDRSRRVEKALNLLVRPLSSDG